MTRTRPATRPGPLDERLVEVALKILAEEGIEALTLRRVARDAGVSHGAPQRHFKSRADLLAEVAARGFQLLHQAVAGAGGAGEAGAGDPIARLRTAGRAYVAAAVAHPDLFALMFRPEALDPTNPTFATSSAAAFEGLVDHVADAQRAGWHPDRDTRVLAGCAWAAFHGLASLWSQGAFCGPVPGASLDDAIDTTLELALGRP